MGVYADIKRFPWYLYKCRKQLQGTADHCHSVRILVLERIFVYIVQDVIGSDWIGLLCVFRLPIQNSIRQLLTGSRPTSLQPQKKKIISEIRIGSSCNLPTTSYCNCMASSVNLSWIHDRIYRRLSAVFKRHILRSCCTELKVKIWFNNDLRAL